MKLLVFSEGQHVHCCTGWRKLKYCCENDETISVFRGATCTLLYRLEKAEVLLRKCETISVFRGATCTLLYRLEKAEVLLRK